MMNQMIVNDFVEEMAPDETEASVDGAKRPLSECPSSSCIVRYIWMSVV